MYSNQSSSPLRMEIRTERDLDAAIQSFESGQVPVLATTDGSGAVVLAPDIAPRTIAVSRDSHHRTIAFWARWLSSDAVPRLRGLRSLNCCDDCADITPWIDAIESNSRTIEQMALAPSGIDAVAQVDAAIKTIGVALERIGKELDLDEVPDKDTEEQLIADYRIAADGTAALSYVWSDVKDAILNDRSWTQMSASINGIAAATQADVVAINNRLKEKKVSQAEVSTLQITKRLSLASFLSWVSETAAEIGQTPTRDGLSTFEAAVTQQATITNDLIGLAKNTPCSSTNNEHKEGDCCGVTLHYIGPELGEMACHFKDLQPLMAKELKPSPIAFATTLSVKMPKGATVILHKPGGDTESQDGPDDALFTLDARGAYSLEITSTPSATKGRAA